ncbi:acid phosphatase, secreted [Scheffersomyces amazonensis]|uniref:acid phosphatase, secreted n=1 Tax=Scheffersomyces amazonensis TaxID=1078765 RepID=UPI00315DFB7F
MVSFVQLFNHGLLLVDPQSLYKQVATPQQVAKEQYNIVKYLGGSAPYIQRPGFGLSTELPNQCELEQVHLLSRHGERYPSKGDGVQFESILAKFQKYGKPFKGDLQFLNDYEYFVTDSDNYEKETSPLNSHSPYDGISDEYRHGSLFRNKYDSLYNPEKILPIFTTNSKRCYDTSESFARGFLGEEFNDNKLEFVIISEDKSMGINSLTPRYACSNFNGEVNREKLNQYDRSFLNDILARFQHDNPGLDLTPGEVNSLFLWCAFEINVKGHSPFCDLFTNEEFIKSSYSTDLGNYYTTGPGNPKSKTIGSEMVSATLKLLQDTQPDNKIWLSFTHDTDMEMYLSCLGIIDPIKELPVDRIPFPNPYSAAEMLPQGARIYIEKFKCNKSAKQASYVRYIINDSVVPIRNCLNGPGFSCEFSEYEDYINNRLQDLSFKYQCQLKTGFPDKLTFYWDYKTTKYDSPLIDQ